MLASRVEGDNMSQTRKSNDDNQNEESVLPTVFPQNPPATFPLNASVPSVSSATTVMLGNCSLSIDAVPLSPASSVASLTLPSASVESSPATSPSIMSLSPTPSTAYECSSSDAASPPTSPLPQSKKVLIDRDNDIKIADRGQRQNSDWISAGKRKHVSVNRRLFETVGLVAFKEESIGVRRNELVTENTFVFGSKRFTFGERSYIEKNLAEGNQSLDKKTDLLFNKLQQFSDSREIHALTSTLEPLFFSGIRGKKNTRQKEAKAIVEIMKEYYSNDDINHANKNIIHKQKDNASGFDALTFLPFSATAKHAESEEKFGFMIQPWLSEGNVKKFIPAGFKRYVMASCMFGTSIQAADGFLGGKFSIIKHDIKLYSGQKIGAILAEEERCFYEEGQFEVFSTLVHMMKRLGHANFDVYLHLPSIDYLLFGVRLYIEGKMTDEALAEFFIIVADKREGLIARFQAIFQSNGINAAISSPFDSLLGSAVWSDKEKIMSEMLGILGLTDLKDSTQEQVVQRCLSLVMEEGSDFPSKQAMVWRDFVNYIAGQKENIKSLEELFKIGNAVMVGIATQTFLPNEICSLLPYSEMQIQRGYAKCSKKAPEKYVPLCNVTYFDPILGYDKMPSGGNKGNAFYYNGKAETAQGLLTNGIFKQASKNAAKSHGAAEHIILEQYLQQNARRKF